MADDTRDPDPRLIRLERIIDTAINRHDGPRYHHYVPRSYQALFVAQDGNLSVYDLTHSNLKTKGKKGVAFEEELYVFMDDQGERRFDVEHSLAVFENDALPIIKRLCDGEVIDETDRVTLSFFMAFSMVRTPTAMDAIRGLYESALPDLRRHFGDEVTAFEFFSKRLNMAMPRAFEHAAIIFGHVEIAAGRQASIGLFMTIAPIVFRRLFESHWLILESPADGEPFFISDCGLTWIAKDANALGDFLSEGMQFAFPLSPRHCVVSLHAPGKRSLSNEAANTGLIQKINEAIAANAIRYIMGSDGKQLTTYAKHVKKAPEDWFPMFSMKSGPNFHINESE